MKTLTVEEATPGLGRLVDERLTPREALRRLQEGARLTPQQAEGYLRELRQERLAAESLRPT